MGKPAADATPTPSTYFDPFRDARRSRPSAREERTHPAPVNQKIAARPSLRDIIDYLFEHTRASSPATASASRSWKNGRRVTSYYKRAAYEPLLLDRGYSEALQATLAAATCCASASRASSTTWRPYCDDHPNSRSTKLLQGGRALQPHLPAQRRGPRRGLHVPQLARSRTRTPAHVELQMAITERLSQAVEKAWRIEQLEDANRAYTRCWAS